MMTLDNIFKYFEEISKIPRGSGNEKAISDYLVSFAKKHNLEVIQDEVYNIIIKKPATPGYENGPTVILQGHMDMVCEKNKDKVHDFTKDPITLRYIDDMIYADNTTLGADNGIAVAMAMAILASDDVKHPPLEVVLTVDEESGMTGAHALNPEHLKGRILINMDTEEEGKLLVSCAGGLRTTITLEADWKKPEEGYEAYRIEIKGLKGGHSGADIDKERGNSNKLLGRVLNAVYKEMPFQLSHLSGGSKSNAIPREAEAVVFIPSDKSQVLIKTINEWDNILKNEYKISDPEVTVNVHKADNSFENVLSWEKTEKAIALLMTIPNGIQTMSKSIDGLVESSNNLGVVSTNEEGITFDSAVRSSLDSLKEYIKEQIYTVAKLVGANFNAFGDYPGWEYNPNSRIREVFQRVYREKYGKEAEIIAVHAGVECGLFGEKIEGLDMISFGPDMYDVHTPNEHVSISSTKRTYEYLLAVLETLDS
ncbi:MAG: aminoacyl-histidine dipeptidase [Clostridiales bacterium]|nr:aminoacyl-histidine dipeptidase [Clostridiales bacterium]